MSDEPRELVGTPSNGASAHCWFRDMAERAGAVFYILRAAPDFAVEFVSESVLTLTGYSAAELRADPELLARIVHPDDAAQLAAILFSDGHELLEAELRWIHRDGRCVWLRHWARRQTRPDGSRVWEGTAQDVTGVRRAERALAESSEQYRLLAEQSSDFIVRMDAGGDVVYISPSVAHVLGWLPEQMVGRPMTEFMHPDNAALCMQRRVHMDAGETVSARGQWHCADGSFRWLSQLARSVLEPNGVVTVRVIACKDIDAEVQAELALAESEERYRRIADNVSDVIWVLDLAEGRFTYVSPSVERLRGYTPDEVLAQSLPEALTPESIERVMKVLPVNMAAFMAGEVDGVATTEVDQPCKDGRIVSTEVITSFLVGPDGQPRQVLGVTRDITERHAAQEALGRRIAELNTLAQLAERLVRHADTGTAMDAACELLAGALEVEGVAVYSVIDEGMPVAAAGFDRPPSASADGVAAATSVAAPALDELAATSRENGEFLLAVPLIAEGEMLGTLVITSSVAAIMAATLDNAVVQAAADLLAAALRSARLRRLETQQAAASERQRIARDLHDAVTQSIYSASLMAGVLPELWERDPARAREEFALVRRLIRSSLAELRILLYELRPEALATAPLDVLLERLVDTLAGREDLVVDLVAAPDVEVSAEVRLTFYRVAQEALNNVAKYARATRVQVLLHDDGGELSLTVHDHGCGFDEATTRPGMGLSIMRERAEAIAAEFTVVSEPGQGTTVELVWRPSSVAEAPAMARGLAPGAEL